MVSLLEDMKLCLTDMLLSGLATAPPQHARSAQSLSQRAEAMGLHQGAALFADIASALEARTHRLQKEDQTLTEAICQAARYTDLCRERLSEEIIRQRWQEGKMK